jgi:UbiD family decarboxylase
MNREGGRRIVKDMRDWIAWLEEEGQLARIRAEVDWDEEMGTITRRAYDVYGDASPAMLFENTSRTTRRPRVLRRCSSASSGPTPALP